MNALFAFGIPGNGELLIILLIVIMVFGAGKVPQVMKELGEGVKSFRKMAKEDEGKE